MKQTINNGTILILDIGKNTAQADEKNSKSFFEQAKECAARIIERKIITQDKTYLGIILMGSNKTKNRMASESPGVFKNIEVLSELAVPTWQLIHDLPIEPGHKRGDWFDALIVAADHFKNAIFNTNILNKKIILMTNFKNPSYMEPSDIENALYGFKEEQFEVDVIGPDLDNELSKVEDIDTIKKLIEETNGVSATFEYAMTYLTFHKKKAINAKPWNADLSIGPNIRIPVSAYIRIKDEPAIKKWTTSIKDPVTSERSKTEGIVREKIHVKNDDQSVVENNNVIKGYHFGQQIIPFADCDKNLLYDSGDKCLSVYGFTKSENIKWENLNGDGLYYVFGRKGDSKAQLAITCLVECLNELKLAGIVRKVYNKGNAPKMYALMPVIDTNNYVCLSLINICYKEEYKIMSFPPTNLKKFSCTNDQVNAFKELINAMDLTKAYDDAYDDSEAFPIGESVSPAIQYVYDCIVHRAMNPDKPLPQPRDEIMALFKVPPLIEKRAREPLSKINELFTLTKVEKKTRKHKLPDIDDEAFKHPADNKIAKNDETPALNLPSLEKTKIEFIGTVNPTNDFATLLSQGKPIADLSQDMTEIIEKLFFFNLNSTYTKALETLTYFREKCASSSEPSLYNDWMKKFKQTLVERNKVDLISAINEGNLSYITKTENAASTYLEDTGDSQLYENDTVQDSSQIAVQSEVNDLFDAL